MKHKDEILRASEQGFSAYHAGIGSAPYQNVEFIKSLPHGEIGGGEAFKLRIKLYRAYAKAWHKENANDDSWKN